MPCSAPHPGTQVYAPLGPGFPSAVSALADASKSTRNPGEAQSMAARVRSGEVLPTPEPTMPKLANNVLAQLQDDITIR